MQLEPFDLNNIPQIVDRVKSMWAPDYGDAAFRLLYTQMVVRHNMAANDLQFQITENGKLRAITFAEKKDEKSSIDAWWQEVHGKLPPDQQDFFTNGREYLHMMDQRTFSYMQPDDVKLSLFVSLKTGWGKIILKQAMDLFRSRGYKNMFLWTDCECDVDWYFERGYELVEKGVYEPFCGDGFEYLTYVFKKKLDE